MLQVLVQRYLSQWLSASDAGRVKAHEEMKKLTFEFIMQVCSGRHGNCFLIDAQVHHTTYSTYQGNVCIYGIHTFKPFVEYISTFVCRFCMLIGLTNGSRVLAAYCPAGSSTRQGNTDRGKGLNPTWGASAASHTGLMGWIQFTSPVPPF